MERVNHNRAIMKLFPRLLFIFIGAKRLVYEYFSDLREAYEFLVYETDFHKIT